MKKGIFIILIFMLFLFQGSFFQVEAKTIDYKSKEFKAVASQFLCNCGCGLDHYECDPNTCAVTKAFKKNLVKMMNKGWDKDRIRQYYVNIYGESILTAPEKSGFSLTAWVLPFVALGAAAITIFFILKKWVKRKEAEVNVIEIDNMKNEAEREIFSSIIDEERKKYL